MQSHHKFNEHKTVESVVNRIKGGETVALISDAGTPGISDPGFLVVRECVRNGIEVQCLPGATAFVPALVASGLPNEKFCFEGFLPQIGKSFGAVYRTFRCRTSGICFAGNFKGARRNGAWNAYRINRTFHGERTAR